VFLSDFAQTKCATRLPGASVARVFEIHEDQVWKIQSKARKKLRTLDRGLALVPEQEDVVVALIETGYHQGNCTTRRDVLNFVESEFGKCLTYRWMHSFLARNEFRVCHAIVSPQEQTRCQVPLAFLDQYMALIKEWLPLAPGELIFNIDECGCSDGEERKAKPVLIRSRVRDATSHDPVDRGICYQTLVCCVTAAGDACCLRLVSGDRSVTHIFNRGVRAGIGLKIAIASSLYVTQHVFNQDIDEVLIPAVISNRDLPGCKDKPAILFCDHCSAHCSNAVRAKWRGIGFSRFHTHHTHRIFLRHLMSCCLEFSNERRNIS
jgi:hypothetical protein